jgi:light-regulated signal transduction histidine kinase (bacteriophytochrome)
MLHPAWLEGIIHSEDREKAYQQLQELLKQSRTGVVSFRGFHKDGQVLDLEAYLTFIIRAGVLVGTRGVMMDVTERMRLVKAQARYARMLRRSNDELQQFASVVSHDLQEPLRMITSYLQLIEQRYTAQLDDDGRQFMQFVVDGAIRMKQLISDLLALSRIEGGEKVFEEVAVQSALDRALANLHQQIETRNAIITQDAMPRLKADEIQLVQLFQNLISNALKFQRDRNPQIHIGAQRKGDEWEFFVRDYGIVIAQEHLERIFVIFQRLHLVNEYPGTGVGLAICKKVVEGRGGRIWVISQEGEGTTFYFTLPI